ncbi:MAG: asparagine synthase (glutamine-hydrolyzing) [Planctomycetota bacterium]
MCGIAGYLALAGAPSDLVPEVGGMVAALDRRGPDGSHVATFDAAVLGHARLAIIDLDTGDQPQGNADDSVVVVVNGEIYNYVELRRDLEARGHRFRTRSDIEVIPHLYDECGLDFVDRLRGMFAIALYDRRARRLVLVRDRLGKKPIYWARTERGIAFASELKSFAAVAGVDRRLDWEAVEDFLTYQYVPAPRSILRGVSKLPAAHRLVVEADGSTSLAEYWSPPTAELPGPGLEAALERLAPTFDEAVRIRLRADVPLGAFLSSGIDSTLVCATASPMLPAGLATTTIAFDDRNRGEVELAERVAARIGARHHTREIRADASEVFEAVSAYLDEPLADSSTLPTWMVSAAAREEVKVAISGDGGDESFGGYAWRYGQNLQFERLRRLLPLPRLFGALAAVYPKLDRAPKPLRLKYGLRNLSVDAFEAYFLDMSVFRPEDKDRLYRPELRARLGDYDSRGVLRAPFDRREGASLLERLLYTDLRTYLAEGVLAKVDRMSMGNSLEVRSPLLDQEVVEFAFGLPAALKIEGGRGKIILRELARRRVGEDVATAPKSGFAPPLAGWLRAELGERLRRDVVVDPKLVGELFRAEARRMMYEEHRSGARDWSRPLWSMLVLETWYRNFGRGVGLT